MQHPRHLQRLQVTAPAALLAGLFLTTATQADELDFEGLDTGEIVSSLTSAGGVGPIGVEGFNPNLLGDNAAVVFDSADPTGGDVDLGTPNEDFGGPGEGSGGETGATYENDTALGKILILAEDLDLNGSGLVDDPDDAGDGGHIDFDFTAIGGAVLHSLSYIDIEGARTSDVQLYDMGGFPITQVTIPAVGDNGVNTIDLGGISGVGFLVLTLGGSGALTGIEFDQDCQGSIGDRVWADLDGDGLQTAGEPGIPDVLVILSDGGGGVLSTATPDDDGNYAFTGLCAGDYQVSIEPNTLPGGHVPAPCNVGGDDEIDNDCSPADVTLDDFDSERTDVDFGYIPEPYIYCESTTNTSGNDAVIDFQGSTSITTADAEFVITGLPANKPAYLFYGFSQAEVPFGEGVRCIGPPFFRYRKIPSTGPLGEVVVPIDFSSPPLGGGGAGQAVPGIPLYFQLWYRDPQGGPEGFNTTGGVCVTFAP